MTLRSLTTYAKKLTGRANDAGRYAGLTKNGYGDLIALIFGDEEINQLGSMKKMQTLIVLYATSSWVQTQKSLGRGNLSSLGRWLMKRYGKELEKLKSGIKERKTK